MNSGLQDKMYKYEVTPPAGVWDKIVPELDDSALNSKFPGTLQNMEVSPPAKSWQHISLALDESIFIEDYSAKLTDLSIPAPVSTWDKIKDQLDAEMQNAAREPRRIAPFLRYAVAASVIGLLTWGAFQLFNNKNGETPIAKEIPVKENPESVRTNQTDLITNGSIAVDNITASLEEARNDAALEASKNTYAKLDVTLAKSKIKNVADFYFVPEIDEPGIKGLGNWQPPTQKNDLSDRYFFLMTPEGNIIRISKKLSDIVGCVAGAEQDKECLDQLKKWQQKMANPKSIHSSGNLLEILNLANSL